MNFDDIYIAIPKAITDIYWNKEQITSQALGIFVVKPEIKKGLLGKIIINGYNEAITGERIINHIPFATEDNIEYKDVDYMIEKEAQVGDLAWEIVDKSTADRILPPEELEKYMSMSPEEISKQLQNIHVKAKTMGQIYGNLETQNRLKRENMTEDEIYIAIPKAITDIYWNRIQETSQSLGMFLVNPEIKNGILGKPIVTGFNEAITGEKIIKHIPFSTENSIEYKDVDYMIEKEAQVGDLAWEIVDKSTAERLLPPEELEKYMSMSPEEIYEKLQNVHNKAKDLGQAYNIESITR